MEVLVSHGVKLKKQLELNFTEGEKVKVSPIGEVVGLDGRVFKIDGKLLVDEIIKADLHIPLDINHRFDEAIGWFDKSSFEVRDDGVYGLLELNQKGKELVENKSYRYLSPVYIMADGSNVVGLDSVGLVNRPNLLNKELNEKEEKQKIKEQKMEELEALKTEIEAIKGEISAIKIAHEEGQKAVLTEISAIGGALKEMNKKITLLGGKSNLEANAKQQELSENDKKIADLLGITPEEYLASKEAK